VRYVLGGLAEGAIQMELCAIEIGDRRIIIRVRLPQALQDFAVFLTLAALQWDLNAASPYEPIVRPHSPFQKELS
jgi:hypothetical protein